MAHSALVQDVVLAVHGGTGIPRKRMTPELEKRLESGLENALRAGFEKLAAGSALDAVETSVRVLEDWPEFNAGHGAVFTEEGTNELDAAIMDGSTRAAGAVAGLTTIKNPISLARAVMEKSEHVLLISAGAEKFARQIGAETVDPSYFRTEYRYQEWEKAQAEALRNPTGPRVFMSDTHQWGTVGAISLDKQGNLAAATSTGGMTNKHPGRVGDTPILGAGTYADNAAAAVSGTGHGEFFLRFVAAHETVALMKYKALSVADAVEEVVNGQMKPAGGEGALIALDRHGRFTTARTCEALYRGYITSQGKIVVALYD